MESLPYTRTALVSLPVTDIVKSERWYRDVLKFDTLRTLDIPPWCEMQTPVEGLMIGLAEVTVVRIGDTALTLSVVEIENCRKHLVKCGCDVSEIIEVDTIARVFSVLDPDGHTIMFRAQID